MHGAAVAQWDSRSDQDRVDVRLRDAHAVDGHDELRARACEEPRLRRAGDERPDAQRDDRAREAAELVGPLREHEVHGDGEHEHDPEHTEADDGDCRGGVDVYEYRWVSAARDRSRDQADC